MEKLISDVIIPPTADILVLLKYCYLLTLFIYIPFLGMTYGGSILSVFFYFSGKFGLEAKTFILGVSSKSSHHSTKEDDEANIEVAREIMLKLFPEKHLGLFLGAFPLITIAFVNLQNLYSADIYVSSMFIKAIIFSFLGYHFIYKWKTSLVDEHFYNMVESKTKACDYDLNEQLHERKIKAESMNGLSSLLGPIFLTFSIVYLVAALNIILEPSKWASIHNLYEATFIWGFWAQLGYFAMTTVAFTSVGILKFVCNSDSTMSDLAFTQVKSFASNIGFWTVLFLPVMGAIYLNVLPKAAYTSKIVCYSGTSLLFFLIIAYRLYYLVGTSDRRSGSCSAFSLMVIAFCFVSLSGNAARIQATQSFVDTIVIHSSSTHHAPVSQSVTNHTKHH
ncbi:MAG: hypothetical protein COB02_15450 [Candidatus Cloacimonadota bacterium]|nr:MAG: hypothetical protein COB02_15450 [Candidatus Cloacimonadota bacterium]